LAFIAAAIAGFITSQPDHGLEIFWLEMTLGAGVLSGWALFRFRPKRRANQAPEPRPRPSRLLRGRRRASRRRGSSIALGNTMP
jgi:hypothetical protein